MTETASADAAHCEALVRDVDRDRWLATLLAPPAHRAALLALYAFNAEVSRVRDVVSAPLPGEVRLQWWRDMLAGEARGDPGAHPVAAALQQAIARYRLPQAAFLGLIEARTHDLYDDPVPTLTDLEGYCGETSSALMRLASLVLADGGDAGSPDAAGHAGVAHGLTGLLRSFARHAARGQILVPQAVLDRHGAARDDILGGRATPAVKAALAEMRGHARRHLAAAEALRAAVPRAVRAAFLPLALVRPYLGLMERAGYEPFRDAVELPQWRRQWALWRAP
ncbi:phytoene/squalene synthase family protein [Labrys wisconsinensis]|uniref:Phytoene synthase n=1 Tax=Labrys wisconsinensis TaxID=425677 RepID=A0ABU0J6F5_9HYPH|nr:phytoene/squalene synthase family protein [Labrys wisconsinensis]MDQ0468782.1 phytoene synthase [Labrys wisconsinensis]